MRIAHLDGVRFTTEAYSDPFKTNSSLIAVPYKEKEEEARSGKRRKQEICPCCIILYFWYTKPCTCVYVHVGWCVEDTGAVRTSVYSGQQFVRILPTRICLIMIQAIGTYFDANQVIGVNSNDQHCVDYVYSCLWHSSKRQQGYTRPTSQFQLVISTV